VVVVRDREMVLHFRVIIGRCNGRAWNVNHTKFPS
jgi:hypothetical protein